MNVPVAVKEEGWIAEWFSDKNGYGIILQHSGQHVKIYSDVQVRCSAVEIIRTWAEWTAEDLIEEEIWKEAGNIGCIQADAQG